MWPWILVLLTTLWLLRRAAVTRSGAVAGLLLFAVFLECGPPVVLLAFLMLVVLGSALPRFFGRTARTRAPRRDHWQALANTGVAAVGVLFLATPRAEVVGLAALGGALADTLSGEIGQRFGGTPRRLLLGPSVPRGADGGMTPLGTLAGAAVAAVAVALAALGTDLSAAALLAVGLGAFGVTLADSVLGATVEARLPARGNDVVNALATAVGALLALVLHEGFHG